MGNYTIRTNDDEDNAIREAQEHIGAASVSKAFMTAILEHQHNKDEISRLRQALAQEQARNMELAASVKKFRTSLNSMFALADNNPL
ncbi:hypothetical protein BJ925_0332 [Rahnella aquatilis]|nr:hypothetical protein BJ925_0332 [Rahnella aquatilis]